MRILTGVALISALVGGQVAAQEVEPGIFQAGSKSETKIDRHGACRVINNTGSNPVMVATKTAEEWSRGANAFLTNISSIPNVTAKSCELEPRFLDGCRGDGNSYYTCQSWLTAHANAGVSIRAFGMHEVFNGNDAALQKARCAEGVPGRFINYYDGKWIEPQPIDYNTMMAILFVCE